ncbi:hypothetical protein RJ639_015420 [Escallonia herrerae]|uniref:Retrotransposon gag domain-containing protein n=1 Tax=Escallonia herrerae TaxID=1293975 RepID=A0AA88VNU8_9ASTE|nr:hypothetical protein RJ639_015420 [Escallonia herrerae]
MAEALPSIQHSHLDPSDLRLCLTSRTSYDRVDLVIDVIHQSKTVPTPLPNRSPELRPLEDLPTGRGRLGIVPENGTPGRIGDPGEHVYQFETNMLLLQVSDAVMCRAFPTTLRKATHAWFKSLQPRSIYSLGQLSDLFQKHFISSRSQRKNSASLLNIVHEKNESLACFLGRFNAATLEIDNLDESVKYTAFLRGL